MLTLRFARRYLFSKKSHSVINLISGVSVVAVAVPVAAMIILLSVFNGFEGLIKSMASAFDADLTITPKSGVLFPSAELDTARLQQVEGVEALGFVVEQNALVRHKERQQQVTLRGVETGYHKLFPIEEALASGRYSLDEGGDKALIGRTLAYMLGLRGYLDQEISIYALKRNGFSSILPLEGYTRREVVVTGNFVLDAESEERYLLLPRQTVDELFQSEGKSTALLLKVAPSARPEEVQQRVAAIIGDTFRVRTRYELRPTFYDIMTYEKWGIFFIALLVLILASFSMVGALVMLILEKRKEQFTLRALGADNRFIRRIFLGEGALIGGLGALIGLVLGVGITLLQQHLGVVKMPVESFIVESYPVEFRWSDLVVTLLAFAGVVATISQLTVRSMIRPEKRVKNDEL